MPENPVAHPVRQDIPGVKAAEHRLQPDAAILKLHVGDGTQSNHICHFPDGTFEFADGFEFHCFTISTLQWAWSLMRSAVSPSSRPHPDRGDIPDVFQNSIVLVLVLDLRSQILDYEDEEEGLSLAR